MNVKLLRLTTGEDIVAEVTFSDDSMTTISKPFVLIPMAQNPGSSAETKLYFSPFIPFLPLFPNMSVMISFKFSDLIFSANFQKTNSVGNPT